MSQAPIIYPGLLIKVAIPEGGGGGGDDDDDDDT